MPVGASGFLHEEYVTHELKSSDEGEEWYEVLDIDGSAKVRFNLDSGATCNVLPLVIQSHWPISFAVSRSSSTQSWGERWLS